MGEIQRLMAAAVFATRGLDKSPYADLLRDAAEGGADWHAIAREFRRACCGLMGQSAEPPLLVTINAGYLAMPTLIKLSRVLAAKGQDWNELAHLPVEIDLGREYFFHSVGGWEGERRGERDGRTARAGPERTRGCSLTQKKLFVQARMHGINN